MGRRGISVEDEARWVFNRLAEAYRARPGYPDALVARLAELAAGGPVVDLGAGTGTLAIPLVARGLPVTAVEPARRMLEELSRTLGKFLVEEPDRFSPERLMTALASAEETGLDPGRFSLALFADALQWVDPERAGVEARRLLRAGGCCAVVEARFAATPFHRELEALLQEANPKARQTASSGLEQLLSLATDGAEVRAEPFAQNVSLADAQFGQALRSLSFVGPALGEEKVERLVAAALELARRHGGARWSRELTLSWARKRS